MTTASRILEELQRRGPLRDSELAAILGVSHQQVNQAARSLLARGAISRLPAVDGVIRNELAGRVLEAGIRKLSVEAVPPTRITRTRGLGPRVPGWPVPRATLHELGFLEHELDIVGPADALAIGDGLDWNTLGAVPIGPGLYCFVSSGVADGASHVMYVGLSTQLSGIASGTDSCGGARGGQRYGRPRYAGVTRKRINAEVARLIRDGQTVTHWFAVLRIPDREEPRTFLRVEEEKLIVRWKLRSFGWNRG